MLLLVIYTELLSVGTPCQTVLIIVLICPGIAFGTSGSGLNMVLIFYKLATKLIDVKAKNSKSYPLETSSCLIKLVNHIKWNANHRRPGQYPSKGNRPVRVFILFAKHVLVVQDGKDQNDLREKIL